MESSGKTDKPTRVGTQDSRPTIGLLLGELGGTNEGILWSGIVDAAQERDANLICFAGGKLCSPQGFDAQRNVLYDLVSAEKLAGLIVASEWLRRYVTIEQLRELCERYRPLPMVSIELALEGIPSVSMEYERSTRDMLDHLFEVHNCRRIAFIRGPESSLPGNVRYRVYQEVLAERGMSLDPDLVVLGDYKKPSGVEAVRLMLDVRQADFDAVVASNDSMAAGALEALFARGVRVPDDVAVVGFDNTLRSRSVTPPLTTVAQPFYQAGKRAVELVLAQIAGEDVPAQVSLPMELVIRQSCGCLGPALEQAAVGPIETCQEKRESALAAARSGILAEMAQGIRDPAAAEEATQRLLDSLTTEMATDASESAPPQSMFLRELDQALRRAVASGSDVTTWQGAVSALRRRLLPYLDSRAMMRANGLWGQARVMISEIAQRAQAHRALQAEQQAQQLREIGAALITTFEVDELMNVLAEGLPSLRIPSAYLSLYENPESPAEWSWLMLAYDQNERIELEPGGQRFPSPSLVPDSMLPLDRRYTMVVEPLFFREDQIGFVLFEVGPRAGSVYEAMQVEIGNALQGALFLRERQQVEAALEQAYVEVQQVRQQTAPGHPLSDVGGDSGASGRGRGPGHLGHAGPG